MRKDCRPPFLGWWGQEAPPEPLLASLSIKLLWRELIPPALSQRFSLPLCASPQLCTAAWSVWKLTWKNKWKCGEFSTKPVLWSSFLCDCQSPSTDSSLCCRWGKVDPDSLLHWHPSLRPYWSDREIRLVFCHWDSWVGCWGALHSSVALSYHGQQTMTLPSGPAKEEEEAWLWSGSLRRFNLWV